MQQAKGYSALDESQLFVGPNALQKIVASKELDAIVIATPPYYHPHHLEAAVAAGKPVYLANPLVVDVPWALEVTLMRNRGPLDLNHDVGIHDLDLPPLLGKL